MALYLTFLKQDFGTPAHSSHLQMEKRCAVSAISPVGALLFVKQGLLVAGGQRGDGRYLSTSELYLDRRWGKKKWKKIADLPRHIITKLITMLNVDHIIKRIILRNTSDQLIRTHPLLIQPYVWPYDSFSDVGESRVWFASKNLTPCRMH